MRTLLHSFVRFIVYSNCWIGFGAALLTWEYFLLHQIPVNFHAVLFAFFATVLTYTFQRYYKIKTNTHGKGDRLNWMTSNRRLVGLIMFSTLVGVGLTIINFKPITFIILTLSGILSLFYVVKLPWKGNKNLRDIPSLKLFLIGIVWAITVVLIPYFNSYSISNKIPWLLFLIDLIFIISITIPFDVRDLHLDEIEKKTIPQLIGEKPALFIATILALAHYALLTIYVNHYLPYSIIYTILAILLILKSTTKRKDFYYSFVIDGLLVLQPVLLYLDLALIKTSI